MEAWRLGGKDADEPLDRLRQAGSALVEAGLLGQLGEEIPKALAGDGKEATIGGNAHDRLGDAECGDLGVGDPAAGIPWLLRQEIVRRAITTVQRVSRSACIVAFRSTVASAPPTSASLH
jgi:hypothetical protein